MSLASWKKEFYPVTAKQAAKGGDLAAAEHSLKKWEGALPENAERHAVTVDGTDIMGASGSTFGFNDATCALCVRHYGGDDYVRDSLVPCTDCPLFVTLGRRCDDIDYPAPYRDAVLGDPHPMIAALRETVARLRRELA